MAVQTKLLSKSNLFKIKINIKNLLSTYSTNAALSQEPVFEGDENNKMAAWQIHSYGGIEELQLSRSVRIPQLLDPNDVLVKVAASSINPIDVAMIDGYGHVLLNTIRQLEKCGVNEMELPLTLGRDFAGEVVAKGNSVSDELVVGDAVIGVVPPHWQGCHAQYVVANKKWIHQKPKRLGMPEAGSLMYAGLTAWSALKVTGDLALLPARGLTVLVLGASGGVGSLAVQMLRAWGSKVVATCSQDAVPLVESLGVETVIDYTQPLAMEAIRAAGKYDIILDAAGLPEADYHIYLDMLKDWKLAKYITLRSPMLRNTDQLGLLGGMIRNAADLVLPNVSSGALLRGATLRWGYFAPINAGIREIAELAEEGQLVPIINSNMNILDLPAAYKKVTDGHLRGKVVISV